MNRFNKSYKQQGFLLPVAVLMILVVGFLAVAISYLFTDSTNATTNILQSTKALYLAESGLESAQHSILMNNSSCTSINGGTNFTNATFTGAQGLFTVTGATNSTSTTLSSAISATATTIPLTNTTGFTNNGTILIDNELINYASISGNNLINATRGILGTSATTHSSSANVIENLCILTSKGGVPNLNASSAQVTLQTILSGNTFPVQTGSNSFSFPTVVAAGAITLSGTNAILNPTVTAQSANFPGSTMISGSTITISGTATTMINSNSGYVVSSTSTSLKADVIQNDSYITSANLFGQFFTQSKSVVKAAADQSYTSSNINGASGKTIWMNSDLVLSGTTTIGTATSPVVLIVSGNVITSGALTIYGFLYATGMISTSGTSIVNGVIASESSLTVSGTNTYGAVYNASILNSLSQINSYLKMVYNSTPTIKQQVIS